MPRAWQGFVVCDESETPNPLPVPLPVVASSHSVHPAALSRKRAFQVRDPSPAARNARPSGDNWHHRGAGAMPGAGDHRRLGCDRLSRRRL